MYYTEMHVNGMYCGHCVMKVTGALESIGARNVQADLSSGHVSFETEKEPSITNIVHALARMDYTANGVITKKEKENRL